MESLDISEDDITEKFIRASGKGGQKVNKSSSAVYLKHQPTGIEVKCGLERSQSINRFLARRELVEEIERLQGSNVEKRRERERIKKRKADRKRKARKKHS